MRDFKWKPEWTGSSRSIWQCLISACTISICSLSALSPIANAAESATFQDRCAGCHSMGGGALVGPDLLSVKSWEDAKLRSEIKRMEAMAGPLSEQEVDEILAYLKNPEPGPAENSEKPPEKAATEQIPEGELPGSAENGRLLFTGIRPLANGGMSCIACHQAGGQSLGPDLSRIGQKYKGKALVSACQQAAFKVMRPAYEDHKITESEAYDIAKYLLSLDQNNIEGQANLLACGSAISAGILILIFAGYSRRPRGARQKLKRR